MDLWNVQNLKRIGMPTYCKKFLLSLTCESQSGPENQMEREISSHCDKNSAHNVREKYRWIPLLCISTPWLMMICAPVNWYCSYRKCFTYIVTKKYFLLTLNNINALFYIKIIRAVHLILLGRDYYIFIKHSGLYFYTSIRVALWLHQKIKFFTLLSWSLKTV